MHQLVSFSVNKILGENTKEFNVSEYTLNGDWRVAKLT